MMLINELKQCVGDKTGFYEIFPFEREHQSVQTRYLFLKGKYNE
jgi:hypothetical protein